jgi:hypothetical protein
MFIHKLPNAAASKISVTTTATTLLSLIDTAAGSAASLAGKLNAIDIVAEDGDIRVLFDGNTPTSTNGILLKNGSFLTFRGVPLTKMQLISAGTGSVSCSVQVGMSDDSESTAVSGGGAALNSDGELILASDDTALGATNVANSTPEWAHTSRETFVLTNVPNATPAEIIFDMEGYSRWSVQVEDTGGTDTFDTDYEVSNESTDSAAAFLDVTASMTFAAGSASADHFAYLAPATNFPAKAVKIEITTAGAADDADFNVFVYRS